MNIYFLINLIFILDARVFKCFEQNNTDCEEWSKNHVFEPEEPHYFNDTTTFLKFQNLSELDIVCPNMTFIVKRRLNIFAQNSFLLDNDFDLRNVLKIFKTRQKILPVFVFNLKGFNYNSQYSKRTLYNYNFYLYSSTFQFYLRNKEITNEMCTRESYNRSMNFFGMIDFLFVYSEVFYTDICPYVFMDTPLKALRLYQISNSLIFQNKLRFLKINATDLNVRNLYSLDLNVVYFEINSDLLNEYVFRNVQSLHITGIVHGIQSDLFDLFKDIRLVFLRVDNYETFFHSGLKWINSLNKGLNINVKKKLKLETNTIGKIILLQFFEEETFFGKDYLWPDKDICLFKDFPHNQLIYPSILPAKPFLCSCSIIWLIQYAKLYLKPDYSSYRFELNLIIEYLGEFANQTVRNCFRQEKLENLIQSCNFELMFNNCKIDDTSAPKRENVGFYGNMNMFFHLKWLELICEVYFQPTLCFIGIMTNLLIIIVLKNKNKKKSFKFTFYKHLHKNAILNLIFCLIHLISLINVCIFFKISFCSQIFKWNFSQYFKIYIVYFLGDSIKLCSNISYVVLSLTRFYESTSSTKSSKFFNKILKVNIRGFYLVCFLISLVLNSFQFLQFKPNEYFSPINEGFPFDAFDIKYCDHTQEPSKLFKIGCKIIPILDLINNILNNIVFILVNLIIDLSLLRFSHKKYNEKKNLTNDRTILEEAHNSKEKITKMVLINSVFFFISHFPAFLSTIFMMIFHEKISKFCLFMFSCKKILEIFQSFYLISISLQIFLFLSFDKNFKLSLKDLIDRKILKRN
jgi:hypothetical protein